jgi:hypothetical protein
MLQHVDRGCLVKTAVIFQKLAMISNSPSNMLRILEFATLLLPTVKFANAACT